MLGGVGNKSNSMYNYTLFIFIIEHCIGIFKLKNLGKANVIILLERNS